MVKRDASSPMARSNTLVLPGPITMSEKSKVMRWKNMLQLGSENWSEDTMLQPKPYSSCGKGERWGGVKKSTP